jgi:hypothetical protein
MIMAGAIARQENVVARVPALAMANRFGKYKPEEEKAVRKTEVQGRSECFDRIMKIWGECASDPSKQLILPERSQELARIPYTPKDVHDFSLALVAYDSIPDFPEKAGAFLNQLIAYGKDNEYTIVTRHLAARLSHLTVPVPDKRVIVDGDVGDSAGVRMQSGRMVVMGSAGMLLGEGMDGGTITVKGDAGEDLGYSMGGGSITVEGKCPGPIGRHMECGDITVNGMRTREGVSKFRKRITRFQRFRNRLEWKLRNFWQEFGWHMDNVWQPVKWHLAVWGVIAAAIILAPFAIVVNGIVDTVKRVKAKRDDEQHD